MCKMLHGGYYRGLGVNSKTLAKDFHFAINDVIIDALEAATFEQREAVLTQHENCKVGCKT